MFPSLTQALPDGARFQLQSPSHMYLICGVEVASQPFTWTEFLSTVDWDKLATAMGTNAWREAMTGHFRNVVDTITPGQLILRTKISASTNENEVPIFTLVVNIGEQMP